MTKCHSKQDLLVECELCSAKVAPMDFSDHLNTSHINKHKASKDLTVDESKSASGTEACSTHADETVRISADGPGLSPADFLSAHSPSPIGPSQRTGLGKSVPAAHRPGLSDFAPGHRSGSSNVVPAAHRAGPSHCHLVAANNQAPRKQNQNQSNVNPMFSPHRLPYYPGGQRFQQYPLQAPRFGPFMDFGRPHLRPPYMPPPIYRPFGTFW